MYWLSGGMLLGTVTSQILLDFCIVAGWLVLFYTKWRERNSATPSPSFFSKIGIEWAFIGYFVIAVLSIAVNAPDPKPWLYSLRKFTWMAEIYLMIWIFSRLKFSEKKWLWYFSLAFLPPNLYAIAGMIIGYDPITGGEIKRVIGLVNSATYHAHGNGAIFVFFLAIALRYFPRMSHLTRFLMGMAFSLMAISIFLTNTRGIWISVTLASFVLLLLLSWRWALGVGLAYVLAFGLFFSTSASFHHRVTTFFRGNHADEVRKNLYKVFWSMFKEHPLVGIGYWDQYRQIGDYWPRLGLAPDYFTSHAHNQYLNILATTGSLGFLFFASIVLYFLILNISLLKAESHFHKRTLLIACLVTQIEYLLACVTDVTFEYAKLRAILVMTWALLIALKRHYVQTETFRR